MSLLPNLTPRESALKRKRTDLLTNKVQPNFEKYFKAEHVSVSQVVTDPKTLDSHFIVRLPANVKAMEGDSLLLEIKRKIFSSGKFLLDSVTAYSFKVSIALSNLEDGFSFSQLRHDSDQLSVKPAPQPERQETEKQIPTENPKTETRMETKSNASPNFKQKIKDFVLSHGGKGDYQNILPSADESFCTVNFKTDKSAEKIFEKKLEFGEEGLVTMSPGSKAVRFYKMLPALKSQEIKAQPQKINLSKKVEQKEEGFRSIQDAINYIIEMSSNSTQKVWENMEKKYGPEFELLVRVKTKESEQLTPISKKDFLSGGG